MTRAMTQACMCSTTNTALVQTDRLLPAHRGRSVLCTDRSRLPNALSDVYAMGGEPKLALNIMCLAESMDDARGAARCCAAATTRPMRRAPSSRAVTPFTVPEPIYGLAVTGFVHPKKVLTNSGAKPGDVLILTKPLGVGVLTTAAKADLVAGGRALTASTARWLTLNKAARDCHGALSGAQLHGCHRLFGLLGHSFEMAQGSGVSVHLRADDVPYHAEALPAGRDGTDSGRRVPQPRSMRRPAYVSRVRFREPCRICFTTRRPAAACCLPCRSRTRKAV